MSDMTETAQELGPMPDTIHCWHGQFPLSHTGTWATTLYPVDAVHYTRTSTLPVEHKPSEELVAALAREAGLRDALRHIAKHWPDSFAARHARAALVDQGTMRAYRSGAFFARKSLYGEAAALVWEAEAKARHESARAGFRDTTTEPRHVQVPDKTAPTKEYVF